MPVFNAAAGQQLAQPVSAYQKGRAIEQQHQKSELEREGMQMEIDAAPARAKAAAAKADLEQREFALKKRELDLKIGEYGMKVGKDAALNEANTIIGITEGAQESDDPLGYANERMPDFIASLPEGDARSKLEAMASDGFQKDELKELYSFAMAVNKKFDTGGATKSDYTIGDTRYSGATNQPIATNPKKTGEDNPFSKVDPDKFTPESVTTFENTGKYSDLVSKTDVAALSERDKSIRDYQQVLDMTHEEAIMVEDKLLVMKVNEKSGAVQLIDQVGKVVKEIPVERNDVPIVSPKKGETLYDLSEFAAGPTNTLAAAVAIPLAWAGFEPAEKVISARQTFATTNQQFIKALANSKRYPVAEVKRILEDIAMVPKLLDDPKLMRTRIVALRATLRVTRDQAKAAGDDTSMPADYRGDAKIVARDIDNYLAVLGHPTASDSSIRALREDPSKLPEFIDRFGYIPEGFK